MTIQGAIDKIDLQRPNKVDASIKVAFLSELDGLINREIILKHEHSQEQENFMGYDMSTDPEAVLLAPYPYDEIYVHYLASQIDLINMEVGKYNNDKTMFNNAYDMLYDWWNRNNMPLTKVKELRL